MNDSPVTRKTGKWKSWAVYISLLLAGLVIGAISTAVYLKPSPEQIRFAKDRPPTLMMHPLGRDGAYRHKIDNWQLLTSVTAGNDSLVLSYKDTFIASFTTNPDSSLESIVVNHPLHDTILLIIEQLNSRQQAGKLTTDIISNDGKKLGFVIDENMDGQPDLRFEYAGPYLYVWLDESWHRILRIKPRQVGEAFRHTVMYRQQMHQIHLEEYPYRLEPLPGNQ